MDLHRDRGPSLRLATFLFLGMVLSASEIRAQDGTSVRINVDTFANQPPPEQGDEPFPIVIKNPTNRFMTVSVMYIPADGDDVVILDGDDAGSRWERKEIGIGPGVSHQDPDILTRHLTVYFFAKDDAGDWYAGRPDADTPTLTVEGREVHTVAVRMKAASRVKAFQLLRTPTLTRAQRVADNDQDKVDELASKQPLAVEFLGIVVEKAKEFGQPVFKILKVYPDKLVDEHNINPDEFIYTIDGVRFSAAEDFEARLRRLQKSGKQFSLKIGVSGRTDSYSFRIPKGGPPGDVLPPVGPPRLGVTVATSKDSNGSFAGARILTIDAGSLADLAQLREQDVIVEFAGNPVRTRDEFERLEEQFLKPGRRVPLTLFSPRNQRTLDFTVEVPAAVVAAGFKAPTLGITVRYVQGRGLVVADIAPNSPLDGILQVNFSVSELGGQPIRSAADFQRVERTLQPGQQGVSLIYKDPASPSRVMTRFSVPSP